MISLWKSRFGIGGSEARGAGVAGIGVGLGVESSGIRASAGDIRAALTRGDDGGERLELKAGLL